MAKKTAKRGRRRTTIFRKSNVKGFGSPDLIKMSSPLVRDLKPSPPSPTRGSVKDNFAINIGSGSGKVSSKSNPKQNKDLSSEVSSTPSSSLDDYTQ